jgi:hypothetical protein
VIAMPSIWCVSVADREKNFARKRDAIAWLRALCLDERIRPVVQRHCAGAYTFWGPGRESIVLKANVDNLGFPSYRRRGR